MKTTRKYLLSALIAVRKEPKNQKAGICTHVFRNMARNYEQRDAVADLLKHYIAQWPVVLEKADKEWSPIPLFWEETARGTLWDNPLRHELLDWLIERVEKEEKNDTELDYEYSPPADAD